MTKKEINSLNELLKMEVETFYITNFEHVKERIRGYQKVYKALSLTIEYNYIINSIAIKYFEMNYYDKDYINDLIEYFKDKNIDICVNLLNDDMSILIDVMVETYQALKVSNEDKIKVTAKLNSISY